MKEVCQLVSAEKPRGISQWQRILSWTLLVYQAAQTEEAAIDQAAQTDAFANAHSSSAGIFKKEEGCPSPVSARFAVAILPFSKERFLR